MARTLDGHRGPAVPVTHWTHAALAEEVIARGIVTEISAHSIGRFLREVDLKPHRTRGWINSPRDAQFEDKCRDVCETYCLAPERAAAGIQTRNIDEMTGVQALERAAPTLPMRPGRTERREFEDIRHGTLTLIASFDVATGRVTYRLGPTRTEADFAEWLVELLASRDAATHRHLIMDNLGRCGRRLGTLEQTSHAGPHLREHVGASLRVELVTEVRVRDG
ncbi:transposase [Thiocapsa rosea]|uniref:transposase n=1 Tax=Thiocapsa rosea TaxID=69360 RepID=UPI001FE265BB|nr:transposase [Thiocapsa rosea]